MSSLIHRTTLIDTFTIAQPEPVGRWEISALEKVASSQAEDLPLIYAGWYVLGCSVSKTRPKSDEEGCVIIWSQLPKQQFRLVIAAYLCS